jgi:prepilin-type N-terminal cleavage/methylation domain-containing protein
MTRIRGFTLVEVLVGLVVGSFLAALVFATVTRIHQVGRSRGERAGLEVTLRNAVGSIARDLESTGADTLAGPDLAALAPQAVTLRAARGLLVICALALPDTVIAETAGVPDWSPRAPVPIRDSLLLYVPGDSTGPVVDAWLPVPLVAGPYVAGCPSGAPAWRLVVALDTSTARARRLSAPTVARVFETVGYRLYGSTLGWQVGQEGLSAGAAVQPIAGPFTAAGLTLDGLSATLAPIGAAALVRTIAVHAVGPGHRESAVGPGVAVPAVDSLKLLIPLRNAK